MDQAVLNRLYMRDKKSAGDISKILNCSEGRINYWLGRYGIKKRSIAEAIYQKNNPTGDPFNIRSIRNMEDAKLLGLGLGLYWGEGNKKNKNSIRLGNTDPRIIRKFVEFLIEIFGVKVEKLRFGLQLFSDMESGVVIDFWLNELREYGINNSQFFKITVTPARSIGSYREKSKFGVLTVYFCNTKLKKIIDNMLPL